MTDRRDTMTHEFVQLIPGELEDGVVYVSIRYRVVTHLCPCGCGERVVTPLHPMQWTLSYDGETVSLNHSIGGGGCNSHYFITRDKVRWALPLTDKQRTRAARRDLTALRAGYDGGPDLDMESGPLSGAGREAEHGQPEPADLPRIGIWARLKRFFTP
jgi:hypothetical protein